jgi:hypothetical protein
MDIHYLYKFNNEFERRRHDIENMIRAIRVDQRCEWLQSLSLDDKTVLLPLHDLRENARDEVEKALATLRDEASSEVHRINAREELERSKSALDASGRMLMSLEETEHRIQVATEALKEALRSLAIVCQALDKFHVLHKSSIEALEDLRSAHKGDEMDDAMEQISNFICERERKMKGKAS